MPRGSQLCALALTSAAVVIAPHLKAQTPAAPKSALSDVPYGKHERQVLDFYQAKVERAAPLLFFIHGGGWMTGDKANPDFLAQCLENGISVASINYRFIGDAAAEKVAPPVKVCLDDAARALQFVRSKAVEWHIDKGRIGGCGGSAGGFTALWLAFHPDMADAACNDPIARESTRLRCVLAFVPQTTLDPQQMLAWIPNIQYGNHAFALGSMQEFLEKRQALLPWIQEFSPYALATSDDPPVLLFYDNPPRLGQPYKDPPHSANFGAGLEGRLNTVGIEHEINYNNDFAKMRYPDLFSFLLEKLKNIPANGRGSRPSPPSTEP
ncbi:MAG TPA: alpha/beta hydrolase [Verrucomicrobiae bacterium]|nr:alpha/beta hydrolase [Verrucomicrobiae bacterium]